jgi:probable LLM family oxidoreductase
MKNGRHTDDMDTQLELGLDTFGDVGRTADGQPLPQAQVIRDVVAEAVLADEVGVDFIGVGEHHRADFAVSSPEMVLAAIAGQTTRIRLGSAVTVLSSDDPVRVFQRFSTLDAVSNGRAEVILGRGSFTESFPLFGYALEQYELLSEEKLALFAALLEADRTGAPVTWQGQTRAPLAAQRVFPRTEHGRLTTWVGVGGSPQSVVRAALYGMPLMLAIIGGNPQRFAPYVDLYHRALAERGLEPLPVGVHSPGHVGETDAAAREEFWSPYREMRDRIGAERGWGPMSRAEFDREIESGSLYVGSPETVARKIAATAQALGIARFDLK